VKRLQREREARGWSKSELARQARMANSTVGAIEAGRLKPYPSQLAKLSEALDWEGEPEQLLHEVTE
jgi:ribosome-binding protein aMBF1 (putative translation factor)